MDGRSGHDAYGDVWSWCIGSDEPNYIEKIELLRAGCAGAFFFGKKPY